MTRRAAVAGQFYPKGKWAVLEKILSQVCFNQEKAKVDIRILVAPHAGIRYSGKTAGRGYAYLKGKEYNRVILLGTSHQAGFPGAIMDENTEWESPLGRVEVEKNTVNQIISDQLIRENNEPHKSEHSLEMQLIFLQYLLKPGFRIVPILLGQIRDKDLKNIGIRIARIMGKDCLLVISSDLSHYPEGRVAEACDRQVIESYCAGDPVKFVNKIQKLERTGFPNYLTAACGAEGMAVGLYAAQNLGKIRFELVDYSHSGMITGDNSGVVGYAAIIGYKDKN